MLPPRTYPGLFASFACSMTMMQSLAYAEKMEDTLSFNQRISTAPSSKKEGARFLRFAHCDDFFLFSHLLRVVLVILIISGSLLTATSLLFSPVHAATKSQYTIHVHPPKPMKEPAKPLLAYKSHQKTRLLSTSLSSTIPFDGTGQLPFYTYITHAITSPTCTCGKKELLVNVANGNLIFHSVEMQIHGTAGLDLSIEAYYNSQASYSRDLGQNWVLSLGHDVRLDLSNPSSGITYHGPSGYAAYFAYNASSGKYTDAPGLNATLTKNGDGTYTLSFHKTGARFIFASGSHLIAVKDKNNNTISLSLDGDNDVKSITDTHGRVISFSHNTVFGTGHSPEGQVTQFSDPTGRTATYSYTNNQLTSETDLNGKTTSYKYSGSDLVQITDPMNNITKIGYNNTHQVTSITDSKTGVMTFTYNAGSTIVNDQRQHNTTYNYDTMGKVISVVNDNGLTTSNRAYTSNYDMNSFQDGLTNTTTAAYSTDGYNNLMSTTDGNNVTTSLTYPTGGSQPYYPTGTKDAQANASSYVYDTYGNLTSSTNTSASPPIGTSQTYNSDGTLHTSKDADGYTTTYGYSNGDLTSITPPAPQHSETLGYDTLSRISMVTDGNGNQTSYTYNKLDRIQTISYKNASGGDTSSITYSYDDDGNVLSVADSTGGTTSFSYDSLNRQTKKILPDSSVTTYTYDATGNLTSLTDRGGTVTYGYDNLNNMTSLTQPKGTGTETLTFGYDVYGRRISIGYPTNSDGTTTWITYDKGGRVTDITTYGQYSTEEDYSYSYTNPNGPSGNYGSLRYSMTSYLNDSSIGTTKYSYDALNRLIGAATTTGNTYPMTSSYSYDANGNRKTGSTTGSGASTPYSYTYDYSNTSNQLVQVNQSSCSNDGNGNQTGCGSSYKETYNARNQTTSMSSPDGSLSDQYLGSNSDERVQTTGSNAATYTYNILGLGTEKNAGNLIAYTRDNKGNLISERTPGGNFYYLFDGLGSVVALMPPSAVGVTDTYLYDPYGVTEHQTGSQYNPWQFADGYFDASTLYYKYGMRYYDRFGRWTQQDSRPAANPYIYANDDPVNEVDPSGQGCGLDIVGDATTVFSIIQSAAVVLPITAGVLSGEAVAEAALAATFFTLTGPLASAIVLGVSLGLLILLIPNTIAECSGKPAPFTF